MIAPKNDSKPRTNCPVGAQLAICVQVVDLGNQRFKGGDPSRKVYIAFETVDARHVFKEEKGPEPFMLQQEWAWYMVGRNKTKLRTAMESWKGSPFASDEAAAAFDFEKLLGRPATLLVAHKPGESGEMRAYISAITPAPAGAAPKAVNKLICYEIGMGEGGTFQLLPPFLQKKLRESDEFRGISPASRGNQNADDFAAGEPETAEGEPDWS